MLNLIEVDIVQTGLITSRFEISTILGEQLEYGIYKSNQMIPNEIASNGFIAYDPKMLGRGIRVYWTPTEKHEVTFKLSLPSTYEEIHELFAMAVRTASSVGAKIRMGSQKFSPKDTETVKRVELAYQEFNLRLLHEVASTVLDGCNGNLMLGCCIHQLVMGRKEADQFWSGINTNAFRDWMNERQQIKADYASASIYEHQDNRSICMGEYTYKSSEVMIFPTTPEVPNQFIDRLTKLPLMNVTKYRVKIIDMEFDEVLGYLSYDEFLKYMPSECKHYYDGDHILVNAISRNTCIKMLNAAFKFHQNPPEA